MSKKARAHERFRQAAERAGFTPDIVIHDEAATTAEDAAAVIGCDVAQIVKSLVFLADGEPLLVLTSGRHQVDLDRLGAVAGAEITRPTAAEVRAATGFAIGGIPPFGHLQTITTVVDRSLLDHRVVHAAAGTPMTTFPIAPSDLVRVSSGRVADFTAR